MWDMGAKGLGGSSLVVDNDFKKRKDVLVGLLNSVHNIVWSVKGKDKDKDQDAKSKTLTVSLRGEYVSYIFSVYLLWTESPFIL